MSEQNKQNKLFDPNFEKHTRVEGRKRLLPVLVKGRNSELSFIEALQHSTTKPTEKGSRNHVSLWEVQHNSAGFNMRNVVLKAMAHTSEPTSEIIASIADNESFDVTDTTFIDDDNTGKVDIVNQGLNKYYNTLMREMYVLRSLNKDFPDLIGVAFPQYIKELTAQIDALHFFMQDAGTDLSKLYRFTNTIEQNPSKEPSIVSYRARFSDLTRALWSVSFFHSKGYYHRDIKSSNFARTPRGEVIPIDLALLLHSSEATEKHLENGAFTFNRVPLHLDKNKEQDPELPGISEYSLEHRDMYASNILIFELLLGANPGNLHIELRKNHSKLRNFLIDCIVNRDNLFELHNRATAKTDTENPSTFYELMQKLSGEEGLANKKQAFAEELVDLFLEYFFIGKDHFHPNKEMPSVADLWQQYANIIGFLLDQPKDSNQPWSIVWPGSKE